MSDEPFKSPKLHEVCLNDFRVSLVACGDERLDAATQSHVDGCLFCQGRLAIEEAQVRAQVYEPLPAVFQPSSRPQSEQGGGLRGLWDRTLAWSHLRGALVGSAVCAVLGYAVLVHPPAPTVRLKGGETSLSATVQRHGTTVLDDEPLEHIHTLREGDQLRLRLAGNRPVYVVVQGLEDGAWVTYYKGAPPADGWLPFGIELTRDGQTRLRLLSCDAPPDDHQQDAGGCVERLFIL